MLRDEESVERRKFQYAAESDAAREAVILRRNLRGAMEASVHPVAGLLPTIQALSKSERRDYSIVRGLQHELKESHELTLESEISASIAKYIGQAPIHGGLWMPLRFAMSGLDTKTNAAGSFLATGAR